MIHHFINKNHKYTFVLLHGTGADEFDLIPLAENVAPDYNILSLRGRVKENGMNRFFKRLTIHKFDLDSVREETAYILNFLHEAKQKYAIDNFVFLGYSNGATMISSFLLEDQALIKGAVLLQPGLLKTPLTFPQNNELSVFISVSNNDPYLPISSQKQLINALNTSFSVAISRHEGGHGLPQTVFTDLYQFLKITFN
ncbi:MAG TPA: alpha/beta hydrolase [Bacilli bacterium]|nr:alpha/beta hydrolase [Bacilli bacterium]